MDIYTIGHSNHPFEKFLEMLLAHGIELVADVRTVPRSSHNPQYNSDVLAAGLRENNIVYRPFPALGGLRHPRKESPNRGWRNDTFRGFADYMQRSEFGKAIEELIALTREQEVVVLCAEAEPQRCHRSLIADALTARGITVLHITGRTALKEHVLTPFAQVNGTTITYPGDEPPQLDLFGVSKT